MSLCVCVFVCVCVCVLLFLFSFSFANCHSTLFLPVLALAVTHQKVIIEVLLAVAARLVMRHDECLVAIVVCRLFNRLILEAPLLTPGAIDILKKYCQEEVATLTLI